MRDKGRREEKINDNDNVFHNLFLRSSLFITECCWAMVIRARVIKSFVKIPFHNYVEENLCRSMILCKIIHFLPYCALSSSKMHTEKYIYNTLLKFYYKKMYIFILKLTNTVLIKNTYFIFVVFIYIFMFL